MEYAKNIDLAVSELISSTHQSLPTGSITFPGTFEQRAEAYVIARKLGIKVGVANGLFTYMFSEDDCKTVQEYMRKKKIEEYYDGV